MAKKPPKEFSPIDYAEDFMQEAMVELVDNMRTAEDPLARNDAAERLVRIALIKEPTLQ
jgi:hypothetical protein